MKRHILGLMTSLCLTSTAMAADLSFGVGADYTLDKLDGTISHVGESDASNSHWTGFADFRHPLLLLPNVGLQASDLSSQGEDLSHDLTVYDVTFYYRPFELGLVNLDFGLDLRRYDGSVNNDDYQRDRGLLFLGAEANLPWTGIGAFGDARLSHWQGDNSHDWKIGLSYTVNPDDSLQLKLRGGYRNVRLSYAEVGSQFNQHMDNWFVGTELRF